MQETLTAAEALRLRRERSGLSQYEAQRKLRISQGNLLSLIETGKRVPDAGLAERIEQLFDIPASLWTADAEAASA
jgi:transcriptional regulator with XRE-family HTH domain